MSIRVGFVSRQLLASLLGISGSALALAPGVWGQTMPTAPAQVASPSIRATPAAAVPSFPQAYTLGPGDRIQVDIFNIPEFSGPENGVHEVLVDGSLTIPLVGTVDVQGMTIDQATQVLSARYSSLLARPPRLTVTLLNPRPIRVVVAGEVNRPGPYSAEINTAEGGRKWPTLTQVIQEAGGITQRANIRDIQVRRPQRNGLDAVQTVSLWELIKTGNIRQDVSLRDGDTILVPTAENPSPEESVRLSTANFSPDEMAVQVVGEVVEPGTVTVPANATLNQAILAAGGFENGRARTSSVELVRLNPDGSVDRRNLEVDLSMAANNENNPILRPNDVVLVEPTAIANTADNLGVILSPINAIAAILRIFGF